MKLRKPVITFTIHVLGFEGAMLWSESATLLVGMSQNFKEMRLAFQEKRKAKLKGRQVNVSSQTLEVLCSPKSHKKRAKFEKPIKRQQTPKKRNPSTYFHSTA